MAKARRKARRMHRVKKANPLGFIAALFTAAAALAPTGIAVWQEREKKKQEDKERKKLQQLEAQQQAEQIKAEQARVATLAAQQRQEATAARQAAIEASRAKIAEMLKPRVEQPQTGMLPWVWAGVAGVGLVVAYKIYAHYKNKPEEVLVDDATGEEVEVDEDGEAE